LNVCFHADVANIATISICGAKASKFLAFCQQLTLRRLFHLIGFSIGTYPLAYLIAAVIIAGTSGGILRQLEEAVRLHTFLMGNLTASVPLTGEQVVYGNICGSYCNTNIVRALLEELERDRLGKNRTQLTNLTFPIAKIGGVDIHLERSFY
uniref:Uncharacterized protein n=1 Tax=Parascaris equorum TaxID=6256 RepID=A0A914S540_PAREQ